MKVVILGAGESGVGAALLAKQKGYDVFVSDFGPITENLQKEMEESKIPFELNKHTNASILDADWIVKSPGIPDSVPIIQLCLEKKIPVISEIEFAAKHTNAFLIGITGSNGKTTTTNLTYHLLKTAGLQVGIGGNVGFSFARLLTHEQQKEYYVLELSSFQLDNCYKFRPDIALLLNITPDHMDRYDYQLDKYIAAKFRIIQSQEADDLFIYNDNDKNIVNKLAQMDNQMRTIPINETFFENKTINTHQHTYNLAGTRLIGPHNAFNATCALVVAEHLGIDQEILQEGLKTFVNDPHRLELVRNKDGVEYINDSKATNVDSVYYALLAMEKPLVWMVGGIDKGNDYSMIMPLVKEKVKAIVCLGADNKKLIETFKPFVPAIKETQDVIEAVSMAEEFAKPGMTVLLSPACSSFDLFKNYAARGDQFKEAVNNL